MAWIWATSSDAARRDGNQALAYATKACELSGWNNADFLSTLAAAYAECGNFQQALHWQKRALEFVGEKDTAKLRSRLELYQSGKAYRDR